ncbi:ferritin-like domain-containing protein [Flavisolibacter nicotianae]|uniref:ferritin-like domain-containing protein n=1 Tax=Flavisolibacter nicotianae TaxID=2364882 RepID=UPI000EADDC64|nr:ferritin-like domain-containing protein [Flavisolibacter nicotianae]
MNLHNVITEIEKIDPEVYERLDGRREALKSLSNVGSKIALTALPFALGSLFSKAYGQSSSSQILDVLNFALTLEYLEAEFYNTGLASSGLIPAGADRNAFQVIADHENEHVQFLKTTIMALGGTPVPKPTFDYTAGNGSGMGPFAGVFTNYSLFLAVSQTFEDTGVRAYKGQAANLISSNEVLRAALRIHSVEARHAAHVREIRSRRTGDPLVVGMPQPWITLNQSNIASSAVQPSYNGEENTLQAGVQITGINGFAITSEDASEAFDEPLTKQQVLMIVDPFIV